MSVNGEIVMEFATQLRGEIEETSGLVSLAGLLLPTLKPTVELLDQLREEMDQNQLLRCDMAGISLMLLESVLYALVTGTEPQDVPGEALDQLDQMIASVRDS